jgi:hypothetical protein
MKIKSSLLRNILITGFFLISLLSLNSENNYDVPPLLVNKYGSKITSVRQWKQRRNEIKAVFEQEVYGVSPALPEKVKFSVEQEDNKALSGKATKKRVNLYLENYTNPIELLIYYPNDCKTKTPAFLGYNFWGNHTVIDDEDIPLTPLWVPNRVDVKQHRSVASMRGVRTGRWPVEMIIDAGYTLVTLYCGDIDPDYDDGFENGVHGLYKDEKYTWGTIAAWAWGLSYVMNYVELDKKIDSKKVAIIGHSRLGKTALLAGAFDERFALTISNNSGCGGAALSRRKQGERFSDLISHIPFWFCDNFKRYKHDEDMLPVDQHQLIAMVAPRPVYVASAELDSWSDPEGEFLSAYLACEVYRLYRLNGIENPVMPALNTPLHDGYVGYHIRTGKHDVNAYDWQQFIRFADKHLKKKR